MFMTSTTYLYYFTGNFFVPPTTQNQFLEQALKSPPL